MLKRRDVLLLGAIGVLGAAVAPRSALALPSPSYRRRLPVLGLERHQGRALWPAMHAGDPVRLASAPRDESAPQRIVVYWGDFLIGHLPVEDCRVLYGCLRRDELRASIAWMDDKTGVLLIEIRHQ